MPTFYSPDLAPPPGRNVDRPSGFTSKPVIYCLYRHLAGPDRDLEAGHQRDTYVAFAIFSDHGLPALDFAVTSQYLPVLPKLFLLWGRGLP